MATMKKIIASENTPEKGTKAHRMLRKRSDVMALKRAKSEPGKPRVAKVRRAIKAIRKGD